MNTKYIKMNNKKKILNLIIICVGAAILIYSLTGNSDYVYMKIAGLILLMFGLYTATHQWVVDNEAQEKEDEQNDKEEQ